MKVDSCTFTVYFSNHFEEDFITVSIPPTFASQLQVDAMLTVLFQTIAIVIITKVNQYVETGI